MGEGGLNSNSVNLKYFIKMQKMLKTVSKNIVPSQSYDFSK